MIKFYVSEFGIENGGTFLLGSRATEVCNEEEARQMNEWFNDESDPFGFEDLADWAIHQLTTEQVEFIKNERTLYEF